MPRTVISILSLPAVVLCMSLNPVSKMDNNAATVKKEDWKFLFDGKTTNGWHTYGKSFAQTAWKAEDGTLHLDVASKKTLGGGGDLVTNEEYSDFELKLEWKVAPGANSGIIFYVN